MIEALNSQSGPPVPLHVNRPAVVTTSKQQQTHTQTNKQQTSKCYELRVITAVLKSESIRSHTGDKEVSVSIQHSERVQVTVRETAEVLAGGLAEETHPASRLKHLQGVGGGCHL